VPPNGLGSDQWNSLTFVTPPDYLVLLNGNLTLETTEGKTYDIGPGDLVVNAGNIRTWHNRTDKWASELRTTTTPLPDASPLCLF
jgi:quercetin dioxygenase-like cupin family protein